MVVKYTSRVRRGFKHFFPDGGVKYLADLRARQDHPGLTRDQKHTQEEMRDIEAAVAYCVQEAAVESEDKEAPPPAHNLAT